MKYTVRRPDWVTLTIGGRPHYGYDQEWYPDRWQKLAGCGPTTGSVIIAYIEAKETGMAVATQEAALAKMLTFWPYATPRMHGLYKTRWLMEGLSSYLADHRLRGRADMMTVPLLRPLRPKATALADYIREGLEADAPLGFLNLHNGGNSALYSWHWMPFIALEESADGRYTGTVLDEGRMIDFDLGAWLRDSQFGGGFVRVMDTDK